MSPTLRGLAGLLAFLITLPAHASREVHVLSYRGAEVVGPLFERFTAETGIEVRLQVLGAEAIGPALAALAADDQPAPDLVISVDALRFSDYAAQGLLRPLPAQALAAVPASLRDPHGQWLGLSYRLRGPLYAPKVETDADWPALLAALPQRRVCHRDPSHVYAIGTLAWLRQAQGEAAAEGFARDVLAQAPRVDGGDRDQILAVLDGRCEIAFVNHYYLARLRASADAEEARAAARLHFGFAGADVALIGNVSAIALPRGGVQPDTADTLARWLTGAAALELHARIFDEFPAGWPERDLQLPDSVRPFSALRMGPPLPARVAETQAWARERVTEALRSRNSSSP
ncbi:MAG: extracellular solute-binding protein [Aquimonas sp.]|nr:extracellular solute-binding protein [Aquimonas sp.]